ncbi:MAG: hypothetical protein EXX96DRAFT_544716 [Benjaminiella poitrasii]|nr:MAG: hypothetical protein EXX96DRAFT_544716 [Benjaminiella poitrasii]
MSSTDELLNTLNIIQDKIKKCQEQKREIARKMITKRALLCESQLILRNQLQHALEEDLVEKTKITKRESPKVQLKLNHVYGWIRGKRIWIQAQGFTMPDCIIKQAHLSCVPNIVLPETMCINDKGLDLFLAFDSIPLLPRNFKVYCVYRDDQNKQHVTESCEIEWKSQNDLTWFERLPISRDILQAYFPCYLSIPFNDKLRENKVIEKERKSLRFLCIHLST